MPNCECPGCSKVFTVTHENLGKRARCTECQESFVLKEKRTADDDAWMEVFESESPATTKENSIKVPTRWKLVRELPPRPAMEMMANWFVFLGRIDFVIGCVVLLASVVAFFTDTLTGIYVFSTAVWMMGSGITSIAVGEVLLLLRGIESRLFEISTNIREQ